MTGSLSGFSQWLTSPSAVAAAIFAAIVGVLYLWGSVVTRKQRPVATQGLQYDATQEAELRRRRAAAIEKQQQQLREAAAVAAVKSKEQEEAKRVCRMWLIRRTLCFACTAPMHSKHGCNTWMPKLPHTAWHT